MTQAGAPTGAGLGWAMLGAHPTDSAMRGPAIKIPRMVDVSWASGVESQRQQGVLDQLR
jgi:hypothetical protein